MKTESKHTPGPWFVVGRNGKLEVAQFDATEEFPRALIADVNDCVKVIDEEHSKEVRANARLIAAAPELLEALRTCSDFILKATDDATLDDDEALGLLTDARNEALKAIAKALGN